jgi:ankyrin repeat protein
MSELSHEGAFRLIVQGHLSEAERLVLGSHLRTCPACRRSLAADSALQHHLVLQKPKTRPSPQFTAVYMESAARHSRRSQIMKPIYAIGGAAALALLMLAGWFIIRSNIQTTGLLEAPQLPAISVSEPRTALDDQLIEAVKGKDVAAVEQLLEEGAGADTVDAEGNPALSYAINALQAGGTTDMVAMLLNNGADPDVLDNLGKAPLALAAKNGRLEAVQMLLDAGADVNTRFAIGSANDKSPLIQAVENGHVEIVELLVARGADVQQQESETHMSPLHYAAAHDELEMITILLENGADLNAENDFQWTPLFSAARMGSVESVQALIDAGAEVDALSAEGRTPMMVLIERGRLGGMTAKMMLLLDNGADPNLQDNNGDTALHFAASTGKLEAIPILTGHGANGNLQNNEGQTPLDVAANEQTAEILGEAGEELLIGTWLGLPGVGGKVIITPGGMAFYYFDPTDDQPDMEGRITIEEKWTDEEGNTYYKVLEYWSDYPYNESEAAKWFKLYLLRPAGDVLEGNWSQIAYPEEINPSLGDYHVDTRE